MVLTPLGPEGEDTPDEGGNRSLSDEERAAQESAEADAAYQAQVARTEAAEAEKASNQVKKKPRRKKKKKKKKIEWATEEDMAAARANIPPQPKQGTASSFDHRFGTNADGTPAKWGPLGKQAKKSIGVAPSLRKHEVLAGLTAIEKAANEHMKGTARGLPGAGAGIEPTPNLIKCLNEKHWKSKSNAAIILGKNRLGSCLSGYGGLGHTHAAEISLRAGIGGKDARSGVFANPSNQDAAFIIISQKNDVDTNHSIPPGRQPMSYVRSSVIAVGDAIRLKAREGVKVWAGAGGLNSQGSRVNAEAYGIDLIWGDGKDMQPLVKGSNLAEFLDALTQRLDSLGGIVDAFITTQFVFNEMVSLHTHVTAFGGTPVTVPPSLTIAAPVILSQQALMVKGGLLAQKINLILMRIQYLNPIGGKWICSFKNNTN